ncbi:MAG: zinc-ribbon domain-containing protein, partial [Minicystis sp.]
MDVTCERCRTAYEFDDALVSERGTTVKCTNCGHQFKVRRAEPLGAPERWLVRTIDGREIEFRALRELQAAIAQSLITRDDVLSRGGARPRRLGSIAELEPFFAGAGVRGQSNAQSTVPGLGARARTPTPQGLGIVNMPPAGPRPTEVSVAIPLPKGIRDVIAGLPPGVAASLEDDTMVIPPGNAPRAAAPASPVGRSRSVPPPLPGMVVSSDGAPPLPMFDPETARYAKAPVVMDRTIPLPDDLPPPAYQPQVDAAPARQQASGLLPNGFVPEISLDAHSQPVPSPARPDSAPFSPSRGSVAPMTPTPSLARPSHRASDEGYNEPRFSSLAPPRRTGAARWIVGFVLVGMFALASVTLGRRFLAPAPAMSGAGDERIGPLLREGEKILLDGDLEAAQEHFVKASAFGENDPKVLADLARLAAVRADISWLRVRVLPESDPDLGTAKRELEQSAERLQKAAGRAVVAAPNEPAAVRARIDALRVAGDLTGARKLVSGISTSGGQPDNALVLAELDLAEDKPDWPTVLDRLRTALSGDQNLGRA